MEKHITIILHWKGPFEKVSKLTEHPCVFLVIAAKKGSHNNWIPSSYKLIDIGQSAGHSDESLYYFRLRKDCWERNKPEDSALIYKVAEIPDKDYDETARKTIESYMRKYHDPLVCGTGYVTEYDPENTVNILNSGKYKPLYDKYLSSV